MSKKQFDLFAYYSTRHQALGGTVLTENTTALLTNPGMVKLRRLAILTKTYPTPLCRFYEGNGAFSHLVNGHEKNQNMKIDCMNDPRGVFNFLLRPRGAEIHSTNKFLEYLLMRITCLSYDSPIESCFYCIADLIC